MGLLAALRTWGGSTGAMAGGCDIERRKREGRRSPDGRLRGLLMDSGEAASRRSGEQLNDDGSFTPGVVITGGVGACEGMGEGNRMLGLQNC